MEEYVECVLTAVTKTTLTLNRMLLTVLRQKLLKLNKIDDGTFEPKKLKVSEVKDILLSLRPNIYWADKDERKRLIAEEEGFEVLTIWDSEYNKHKDDIIDKCKKFLNL